MQQTFASLFLVRGAQRPALVLVLWTTLALASVVAATVIGLRPGAMQDLWMLREWLDYWRRIGDPYPVFRLLDYPPNALLLLWPLDLIGSTVVPWLLTVSMVAATAVAMLILLRWCADRLAITLTWQEQAALVAMVLADSAVRTSIWRGQTSPLAILFGALALRWSLRRPVAAAMALSLCAFKPHVAIGFAAAIAILHRPIIVAGALAIVLAQWVVFAATIDAPLLQVARVYIEHLSSLYTGPDAINGLLSINWVVDVLLGPEWGATYLTIAAAVGSAGLIVSMARRRRDGVTEVRLAAACLLGSLIFLPHQIYHGMLAVPVWWLLMWPEAGLLASNRARVAIVSGIVLLSVIDVPRLLLYSALRWGDDSLANLTYMVRPVVLTVLFAFLLWVSQNRANREVA